MFEIILETIIYLFIYFVFCTARLTVRFIAAFTAFMCSQHIFQFPKTLHLAKRDDISPTSWRPAGDRINVAGIPSVPETRFFMNEERPRCGSLHMCAPENIPPLPPTFVHFVVVFVICKNGSSLFFFSLNLLVSCVCLPVSRGRKGGNICAAIFPTHFPMHARLRFHFSARNLIHKSGQNGARGTPHRHRSTYSGGVRRIVA